MSKKSGRPYNRPGAKMRVFIYKRLTGERIGTFEDVKAVQSIPEARLFVVYREFETPQNFSTETYKFTIYQN